MQDSSCLPGFTHFNGASCSYFTKKVYTCCVAEDKAFEEVTALHAEVEQLEAEFRNTSKTFDQKLEDVKKMPGPVGPRGPKGEVGSKGETGDRGVKGEKGDRGANGAPGATGASGPRGTTGSPGARGPTGARGPVGATGSQGRSAPQFCSGAFCLAWPMQNCAAGRDIDDVATCQAAYTALSSQFKFPQKRGLQEGDWHEVPMHCSVQFEGGYVDENQDCTPHLQTSGSSDNSRMPEFRAMCRF